ncbi:MAG: adenosylhomocysteinase [Deltaproteobacteria bacterium GWA2_38_16]|nr:MAG: adenosylhomocysteinase [Deltaproteobacteria bacterium GWA2_38_16]OGQ03509.1 MAG: adenosylhomocysteinase [Deltaproteobacteria bacterium RIFCSPHIGHO2_02_FULL_38_15]OGQ30407.1 MAG: adenosylhomocysteinase [Deltaproteobacteria bacterium RIFCSPLOWO2_01_FULL_38_9]OGQ60096.1 MAG: adenosylhomocysteinase [Deltaproteobacteria bacterium RIFCSPLOWO2_12_FULL_38_8]HBQ21255.1 adenosylhomocysteinase [Deltaproteobacteria bacterium]
MKSDVKDLALADRGKQKIDWAEKDMPVLRSIRKTFSTKRPLSGIRIAACLHVTAETANLMRTLKTGGAEVYLCASNPLSTQDDVAASLAKHDEISVFAIKGEDKDTYYNHIHSTLEVKPSVTMDDGADLVSVLHTQKINFIKDIIGGTEETTTGVIRLKSMADKNVLQYPIIAVNDAYTKHFFDNRYGTGQSTLDGIIRATNKLMAGSVFVVCGYGWCGKGLAMRARGMGARVVVTEISPLAALEAVMDGFQVLPMSEAAVIGDVFCTVTGDVSVIRKEHFEQMKDGAIVSNSGHFNVELDLEVLAKMSKNKRQLRDFIEEFTLSNGKKIYVLAEGRLVNLSAAEGHPASVMDMSFANQSLSVEYLISNRQKLEKKVYRVPEAIDQNIAKLKLESMGVHIDTLTAAQEKYLNSWEMGT